MSPVVAGKPNAPMADLVRARLGDVGVVVHIGVTLSHEVVDPLPDLVSADLATLVDQLL